MVTKRASQQLINLGRRKQTAGHPDHSRSKARALPSTKTTFLESISRSSARAVFRGVTSEQSFTVTTDFRKAPSYVTLVSFRRAT